MLHNADVHVTQRYARCHGFSGHMITMPGQLLSIGDTKKRRCSMMTETSIFLSVSLQKNVYNLSTQLQPADYLPYLISYSNPFLSRHSRLLQNTHSNPDPECPALTWWIKNSPHMTGCWECVPPHLSTHGSPSGFQTGAAVQLTCSLRLPEEWCNNNQPLLHDNEWSSSLLFYLQGCGLR